MSLLLIIISKLEAMNDPSASGLASRSKEQLTAQRMIANGTTSPNDRVSLVRIDNRSCKVLLASSPGLGDDQPDRLTNQLRNALP